MDFPNDRVVSEADVKALEKLRLNLVPFPDISRCEIIEQLQKSFRKEQFF